MRERLESLNLLRHVREGGGDARFELRCCLGVGSLPNFMLASSNEERLFRTEAAFFDSGPNLFPQFSGRVSKVPRNGFLAHNDPLSRLVPKCCRNLLEVA